MHGKCRGCIHRRPLRSGDAATVCCYALDTGELRGCAPDECQKWSGDLKELRRLMRKNEENDFAAAFGETGEPKGVQWYG